MLLLHTKRFFSVPCMSANLPNGSINAALAKINAVGIQLSKTASNKNSLWIEGSAMFRDVPINGIRKEPSTTVIKTVFLISLLSIFIHHDTAIN